ncbi:MAG: acetobutylicum phosphotransbutyrylase [uncultured bacterium]|nr:MAG: acetobutylicum phosphotransbutyrylase [uncultured bacterium]
MEKNKVKNKKNRWVFALATIFWLGVIFLFSSEPNLRSSFSYEADLVLRKFAHIAEYFILTFLIYKALSIRKARSNLLLVSFLLALIAAVFDEYHQMFVVGREGAFRDVMFDAVGIIFAIYFIFRKLKNGKRKNN